MQDNIFLGQLAKCKFIMFSLKIEHKSPKYSFFFLLFLKTLSMNNNHDSQY